MSFRPADDGTSMEAPTQIVNTALDYAITYVSQLLFMIVLVCFNRRQ